MYIGMDFVQYFLRGTLPNSAKCSGRRNRKATEWRRGNCALDTLWHGESHQQHQRINLPPIFTGSYLSDLAADGCGRPLRAETPLTPRGPAVHG